MTLKWLFPVLFLCVAIPSCWAQSTLFPESGGITGVVLTEDGQLAVGAKVCTSVRQDSERSSDRLIDCRVPTDNDGRFTIEHLKLGKYQVFAINETEGYSIENQSPGQDVEITVEQPWPNVTIQQHARGGVLLGSITDKLTGKQINDAQIEITAIDRNGDGGSALVRGDFHVAVSPDCDLLVVVMAKGYRGWIYTDPSNPSRPVLRLASGEQKTLHIQLEPLPSER